jgi:hypothetical protein
MKDQIKTINLTLPEKQRKAWKILHDKKTNELLYGGAAGGGKTYLGCAWITEMCGRYPRSRWLVARKKLKDLRRTTLETFFKLWRDWGLEEDVHYKYNRKDEEIIFSNDSKIILDGLKYMPSDPNYDRIGSLELTGAFLDEANQIPVRAKEVVNSRRRHKLEEYGLIPKTLFTCNPAKNWVYSSFYKPHQEGELEDYKKFIQALVHDNPFLDKNYEKNLRQLDDKNLIERLLKGNWEYDDDPRNLFTVDDITRMFNLITFSEDPEKYITIDVARLGDDKTVFYLFYDWHLVDTKVMPKTKIPDVIKQGEKWIEEKGVKRNHVLADESGVGGGVVDGLECRGFKGSASAIQPDEVEQYSKEEQDIYKVDFNNLRTQCYYKLAKKVKKGDVGISCPPKIQEKLKQDLMYIRLRSVDPEVNYKLEKKEDLKERLGRSPDFSDPLMMRVLFELNPPEAQSALLT